MTVKSVLFLVGCNLLAADMLPIGGIAHVGFRVADLEKTRAFYGGELGMQEAFGQKDASGKTTLAVFKIDENQFLEFSPGTPAGFTHIAFLSEKLEALRQLVETLGLNPPELRTGRDRTRNFSIKDPDNHRIEFVQYEPDSMQAQSRGKFVNDRHIVTGLNHLGLPVANRDAAIAFFQGKLGFGQTQWPDFLHTPTEHHQYVELLPASGRLHLGFEVRGDEGRGEKVDPDGTRIEFVSAGGQ